MTPNFYDLNQDVPPYMVSEVEQGIANNAVFYSPRLTKTGIGFITLLISK